MEHFEFMKELFDANQLEFSLEEIHNLSSLPSQEVENHLTDLCNKKLMKKSFDLYSITEEGRVDFANTHAKRVMIRLLLFSFFMTLVMYFFLKFIS